jgi:uncharacterized protein (TIGR03382 family)
MRKHCLRFAALALLVSGSAGASSNFPGEIRSQLALSYTPDCTLCHAGTPSIGTATTPFATSMRARGLVAGSLSSLDTALAALEAEKTDSDHDGVPDIEELKASTDPNVAGGSLVQPTYGCFNVTGQGPGSASTLAALGVLVLSVRRRRPTLN